MLVPLKKRAFKSCLSVVLIIFPVCGYGFDACFDQAGQVYDISPKLLRTIAHEESRLNPAAINKNRNGTYDFGVMQINSAWEKTLGHGRWMALGDPCYNISVGAWILRQCINRHGYSWEAVGCYNAVGKSKRDRYARKIAHALKNGKTD